MEVDDNIGAEMLRTSDTRFDDDLRRLHLPRCIKHLFTHIQLSWTIIGEKAKRINRSIFSGCVGHSTVAGSNVEQMPTDGVL